MKSMREKDPYHSVMTFSSVSYPTTYLSCWLAHGILCKNQLKRTEFAVDQVLRVSSLRVRFSFAIYGARLQKTMMVMCFSAV